MTLEIVRDQVNQGMPFDPSMFDDINKAYQDACSNSQETPLKEETETVEVSSCEMTML